jgi:uncharacterized membrane protein YhaH (DUF805 family)
MLRIVGWAAWQLSVLLFVFIIYANLFSEYGIYSDPVVDSIAALVFLLIALFLGTWLPMRRWRSKRAETGEASQAESKDGGA